MDLGYTPEGMGEPAQTAPAPPQPKKFYPSFSISGEPAKELIKRLKLKPEDVIGGRVELKVTGWHEDAYETRVTFDVLDLEPKKKSFEEKEPEEQFDELRREAEGFETDEGHNNQTSYGRG